jgi:hypothetical protein
MDAVLAPATGERKAPGAGWLYGYTALQFACQLALLTDALSPARVFIRSAVFGGSLLLLLLVPGSARSQHPVRTLAVVIMTILTLSAFNPNGGPALAVAAHWAMYLAVLAPLFWVARLEIGDDALKWLLLVLWGYHTLSSIFGVLQVYYPGRFQPALTMFIQEKHALTIRLASGELAMRPMGLTDQPGGAAGSGLYATLIGIGIVLTRPFSGARVAGLVSMTLGMTCIYLSQVRSALVMLGVCFIVLLGLLAASGRIPRLAWLMLVGVGVVLVGFQLAFDVAGETVTRRLASLIQSDPGSVYRANRGMMLEEAFNTLLGQYPFGAGLARWGMMNLYFGSPDAEIGAEVQWVAWILDGGLLLVVLYAAAIITVTAYAMRESIRPSESGRDGWAAVIAAYNVGAFALCFSYVPFMSAAGLEVWIMNAVLIQAARSTSVRSLVATAAAPGFSRLGGDAASAPVKAALGTRSRSVRPPGPV